MDVWGIDVLPGKIARYKRLLDYTDSPPTWKTRCLVGTGEALPFADDTFAAVCSWYVFEHIAEPGPCIREMVRVTKPGGIITIRAQDARNGWEGHCKIPWIPFLPPHLERIWIEEFGVSPHLREDVYDITQPQIRALFEEFGCRIMAEAPGPKALIEHHSTLSTEKQVRQTAKRIQEQLAAGDWQPQPENCYIHALKISPA